MVVRRLAPCTMLSWATLVGFATSGLAVHGQESDGQERSVQESSEADLEARTYTWRDGDRTFEVVLQPVLAASAVMAEGAGPPDPDGDGRQTFAAAVLAAQAAGQPVFRSPGGALMLLPGGVLLVVDPSWSAETTEAFFAGNGVSMSLVEPLRWLPNGYFIETEPGFASLDLANALAEVEGVEISTPNWQQEVRLD